MSEETSIKWKMRVKKGDVEVEVVGMTPLETKKYFDILAEEYLKEKEKRSVLK